MTEKNFTSKLANVPLTRPGFDALSISAPVMMQMNPEGKWENSKPCNLDEERLKAVVQHLVRTKAVSAARSYCSQCARENQTGDNSNYVPVILMPIYPADECPFDMKCEVEKIKEAEPKSSTKKGVTFTRSLKNETKESEKEKDKKKVKKRGFVMQRLTDFDLLSQW